MRRVVITGVGIVSSIGNDTEEVQRSLLEGRSGMRVQPEMAAGGYRCHVAAPVCGFDAGQLGEPDVECLSDTAQYGLSAALEATRDAGLAPHAQQLAGAAVVMGTGGGGQNRLPDPDSGSADQEAGLLEFLRQMNETAADAVARRLGTGRQVLSLSAACATGLYCIGHGYELVAAGDVDCCVCGGAEAPTWSRVGVSADNMRGMPTDWNDRPTEACRPFDRDRQGFVISEGAACVVLESWEAASRRGADIYGEVVGYSAANDGHDLFVASGQAMQDVVRSSLAQAAVHGVSKIDYANAHATGTPVGDAIEARVLREHLGAETAVSSCKGHAGHAQGAAGAQEIVCVALMLRHGFLAPTANLDHPAEDCQGIDHVTTVREARLQAAMSLNNGLGGTNAALVLKAV